MKFSSVPLFCIFGILFQTVHCMRRKYMVDLGNEVRTVGTIHRNNGNIGEVRIRPVYFWKLYQKSTNSVQAYIQQLILKCGSGGNRSVKIAGPWIFVASENYDQELELDCKDYVPDHNQQTIIIPVLLPASFAAGIDVPEIEDHINFHTLPDSIPSDHRLTDPLSSTSSSSSHKPLRLMSVYSAVFVQTKEKVCAPIFGIVEPSAAGSRIIRIAGSYEEEKLQSFYDELNKTQSIKNGTAFPYRPFLYVSQNNQEYHSDVEYDFATIRDKCSAVFGVQTIRLKKGKGKTMALLVKFSWMERKVGEPFYKHLIKLHDQNYTRQLTGSVDFRNMVIRVDTRSIENTADNVKAFELLKDGVILISTPIELTMDTAHMKLFALPYKNPAGLHELILYKKIEQLGDANDH